MPSWAEGDDIFYKGTRPSRQCWSNESSIEKTCPVLTALLLSKPLSTFPDRFEADPTAHHYHQNHHNHHHHHHHHHNHDHIPEPQPNTSQLESFEGRNITRFTRAVFTVSRSEAQRSNEERKNFLAEMASVILCECSASGEGHSIQEHAKPSTIFMSRFTSNQNCAELSKVPVLVSGCPPFQLTSDRLRNRIWSGPRSILDHVKLSACKRASIMKMTRRASAPPGGGESSLERQSWDPYHEAISHHSAVTQPNSNRNDSVTVECESYDGHNPGFN